MDGTGALCNLVDGCEFSFKHIVDPLEEHISFLVHLLLREEVGVDVDEVGFVHGDNACQLVFSIY